MWIPTNVKEQFGQYWFDAVFNLKKSLKIFNFFDNPMENTEDTRFTGVCPLKRR